MRPWRIPVSLIEPGPTRADMWADVLDDYDRMTEQLSPGHRELYGSHLAGSRKLSGRMQKLAGDPENVVAAVDRALTSKRPRRRYRCDNLSRAQLALASVAPAAMTDAVLAAATTSKWLLLRSTPSPLSRSVRRHRRRRLWAVPRFCCDEA
jgi:hypothetical protein